MVKRSLLILGIIFCLNIQYGYCEIKYPNFGNEFLGKDKFENFNRKVFLFNGALNKYALRPVTVIWSSIMPKYGIERLKYSYNNILYPRRLVSCLIQRDFKAAGQTTVRFVTNSTIGLGGMFDPARRYLKIKPVNEDMEQALAKLKIKQGPYIVMPILSSATPRALFGRALDAALDPTSYVGSSVIAAIKAGFTINNATILQPLAKTLEQNYADPYDIAKKLYGLQVAILNANLDRDEVLEQANESLNQNTANSNNIIQVNVNAASDTARTGDDGAVENTFKGSAAADEILYNDGLIPDIILKNYNPQHPVTDSMRTALFDAAGVDESMWGDMSLWNRSFKNRIKTASVEITPGRDEYKFKYIMQKDKSAPLAIIYPSVGEGINSHHSVIFAKLFYDEGYSVLIQGSAFHYDFVKSMPRGYHPGIPVDDVKYLKLATKKIVNYLEEKYETKIENKVLLGTSYGALSSLFLADSEAKENSVNISKYISINPPVELLYALNVIDENTENWNKNPNNLKEKTSITAAKILQTAALKNEENLQIETLPFSVEESKLITGFVLHQKLSDLLFALEDVPVSKKTDFYDKIAQTNYQMYAKKYLVDEKHPTLADFASIASLHSIKNFLKNSQNYRIYHSLDDYLVNNEQLKKLKEYSGSKMKLIDHGAHLGFLYRNEFIDDLKKEISLKQKPRL